MSKLINCHIVSAERAIYEGVAEFISLQGTQGELGVLPGHTPLLTTLVPGVVEIREKENLVHSYYVTGGIAQILPKKVTILADMAEKSENLNEQRAEAARQAALAELQGGTGPIDYAEALSHLAVANAQLLALRRMRKRRNP